MMKIAYKDRMRSGAALRETRRVDKSEEYDARRATNHQDLCGKKMRWKTSIFRKHRDFIPRRKRIYVKHPASPSTQEAHMLNRSKLRSTSFG